MSDEMSNRSVESFNFNRKNISVTPSDWSKSAGHTNDEKAFFHGMKAVRRLAEDEHYDEAAEIAGILSEWWGAEE